LGELLLQASQFWKSQGNQELFRSATLTLRSSQSGVYGHMGAERHLEYIASWPQLVGRQGHAHLERLVPDEGVTSTNTESPPAMRGSSMSTTLSALATIWCIWTHGCGPIATTTTTNYHYHYYHYYCYYHYHYTATTTTTTTTTRQALYSRPQHLRQRWD
jgi:hypothetical protein